MSLKIKDTDRGYRRVMRAADGSRQGRRLRVGVKGDEEIQQIAAWQEFGTVTIPERSFLRAWFDGNRERIKEDLRVVGVSVLLGEVSREELLGRLGEKYVAEIQERILHGLTPELAESTIIAKERRGDPDTPLVTQRARLLNAIVATLDDEVVA